MARSVDIFCRVVDNYGDIGVCWRLARELSAFDQAGPVRLWVDDLRAFARIQPQIRATAPRQERCGVEIVFWERAAPDLIPHDIVIEAFACSPPRTFVERMKQRRHIWINLEYLSAEDWVEQCHALPSMQPNGMIKTFFFPGFTQSTGGLLREDGLIEHRDRWNAEAGRRWELLGELGVPGEQIQRLRDGARQILLFCYGQAPAHALAESLKRRGEPSVLLIPQGVFPALLDQGGADLFVHEIPFVDQGRFDQLLWSGDLNFVRGEDSLVRALWAAKPLVWQIYPQARQAHLDKLRAWLDRSPYSPGVRETMLAWNTGDGHDFGRGLDRLLAPGVFPRWVGEARRWQSSLAARPGLARALMAFCAKQWQTR